MVKYTATEITFREVPDKICRTFSISNCGGACPGCHSPFLRGNNGDKLDKDVLTTYFEKDKEYVDCYVFLGEGNDLNALALLMKLCKAAGFEVCLYSGKGDFDLHNGFIDLIDYLKIGPYIEECGGLDKKTTNQRFYQVKYIDNNYQLTDLTWKFLPENSKVLQ